MVEFIEPSRFTGDKELSIADVIFRHLIALNNLRVSQSPDAKERYVDGVDALEILMAGDLNITSGKKYRERIEKLKGEYKRNMSQLTAPSGNTNVEFDIRKVVIKRIEKNNFNLAREIHRILCELIKIGGYMEESRVYEA